MITLEEIKATVADVGLLTITDGKRYVDAHLPLGELSADMETFKSRFLTPMIWNLRNG